LKKKEIASGHDCSPALHRCVSTRLRKDLARSQYWRPQRFRPNCGTLKTQGHPMVAIMPLS
jgi:hypothetical protein